MGYAMLTFVLGVAGGLFLAPTIIKCMGFVLTRPLPRTALIPTVYPPPTSVHQEGCEEIEIATNLLENERQWNLAFYSVPLHKRVWASPPTRQ